MPCVYSTGKYTRVQQTQGVHVEMQYHVPSILNMGSNLY